MSLTHLIGIAAVLVVAALFLLVLFEPSLRYRLKPLQVPLDSHQFLGFLGALLNSPILRRSDIQLLTDGSMFYPAELIAMQKARRSIHIEAFIFLKSEIADRFLSILIERAKAGVAVRVIIDAVGSWRTSDRYFDALRAVGGQIVWYEPIRWHTLKRFNNRTHRELVIVDGEIGFIGGAGVADWWEKNGRHGPPWRDSMLQVRGDLVGGLQATFAENWLEASGGILSDLEDFPFCMAQPSGEALGVQTGLVIASTPSAAGSTHARLLFQVLLANATATIQITSPYFLPDRSVRRELARAVGRGVEVTIITPNAFNNHPIARRASRRRYGELLNSGVRVFEYQPRMIHAKILIIDGLWTVLGSTNFDNRSFGLNDEVNIALCSRELAMQVQQDFINDLNQSEEVSLLAWRQRPLSERLIAIFGIALERQQ